MMRDRWQYVAATVAIAAGLTGLALMGPDHVEATPVQSVIPGETLTPKPVLIRLALPACLTDEPEGPDCAWNAREHGNGRGKSFVRIGETVHYIDGWDGKR